MNTTIYNDIAQRTDSNIYIGVVGPVRTGKSTFIKRFMETLVIPNIENIYLRERAKDELPQSGSGRTIMTAEPKFVPEDAISIVLENETELSVRLIDCVGYMVNGASGRFENGEERMVSTPWFDHEISMTEAAELGTHKVIADHSTIGLVITTDGTVCDIPREDYLDAEASVISELKSIGKPFIVLVNSVNPQGESAKHICESISTQHGVGVLPVNCKELTASDITDIIHNVLYAFPTTCIEIDLPSWVEALPAETPLLRSVLQSIREAFFDTSFMKDVSEAKSVIADNDIIESVHILKVDMGTGVVSMSIDVPRALYFDTLKKQTGFDVNDDGELLALLTQYRDIKSDYDLINDALTDVRNNGYGIVMPSVDQLSLDEPEVVKQNGKYAVKLNARASAIHMIMTNVEASVMPAIGGDKVSGDIVNLLLQGLEGDIGKIWDSNIFGRSLYEIAAEEVQAKINGMSTNARSKFQETLQRVVNEGAGGLICIIL